MSERTFSWELFNKAPLVGIIRNVSPEDVKRILPIYREAGLTTVEITMNTPGATDMIRYALENEHYGLNIGAGTVCTKDDLDAALDAGAQFIVTPVLSKKVIKSCVKKGVPVFPGAYTPTEIFQAWSWGASMVKIYPATALGPGYIKDVKAPMNQLKLLPTGGVSLENMEAFLKAGANGLGIGGQLFDKKLIQDKDWDGLKTHFLQFAQKLA
ncbi:2-dehydro-3-deoxyphosphogluconate aldolase/(4S)-4-hydroxy-2-oxoglutarate aldolase [Dyadobacter sp. BE34]|uniref:2-dehydro-3-deoxyphosphogluconate aldolase/(4S)-4-hydroxy-2-oxoglutarate aldolase n=1 Tax=Dyadobacter fermentans TaxID=94254 RepID=A0ABU1QXI4_9BACT|nr:MULTISPECIES: bifunctional 4-hydroxy-2-oxoglutarate aldolase/2-dehydro-3-deoxy-phosphogluconate aldolase [Dyadobacter]MDR6805860.1 2-dehydro-3-deoxyphosphogluconate aldolase/(4S)-4-hydroxy-2-oxoglutarate aldolase [Dyadobacter fermentans]MDR7042379.1 2-dehydro-3-deoxyphosphogluconate aldolase/(4S)-4-hydroxy-2-oxoglutarate aldolase [Dyadobacter sp. BE242]MDR7201377.1 2-dehydro-3-deoxyphosphogluconate aldolase/(4S)-4-hydroxy-2-oxoglutarate aldolase [Dyadobacter sp. BE34]MDR7215874.1 2-dehydro-3